MSQAERDPDEKPVRLVKDGVTFLGEQDGPPERELKVKLVDLFARHPFVRRAYLAIAQYPGSGERHVALCVQSARGEDSALLGEIGAAFRSVFGGHEHLDIIFLQESQEVKVAALSKPFFAAGPAEAGTAPDTGGSDASPAAAEPDPESSVPPPAPRSVGSAGATAFTPRQDAADFTPRMPEVDVPPDLEARFARARRIASGDEAAAGPRGLFQGQRRLVILTPGRMCMMHQCPRPGSMQASAVAAIEQIAPGSKRLTIAVIALTELSALRESLARTIPFAGYLLGLAYVGHTVVVFEGHASALQAGCRDADMLIVDEAMIPALQKDWLTVAWSVMKAPQAIVFGRNGTLKRISKKEADGGR